MLKKIAFLLLISIFLTTNTRAQFVKESTAIQTNFSTSARLSMLNFDTSIKLDPPADGKKNLLVAGGLSILYPGLGQAYNRQWVKAGVAFIVETSLIIAYSTWQSKGTQGVIDFESYAVEHWSPLRYATWLNGHDAVYGGEDIALIEVDFTNPSGWSDAEKLQVTDFFNVIRAAERVSHSPFTGAVFSHVLPYHAEQQYFELIGKYFQYAPGWDDYENFDDPNVFPEPDGKNVSDRFWQYAKDHGEANDYLRRASRITSFFILTRFVAGFDALISAHFNNVKLDASSMILPNNEIMSYASLTIGF